MRQKLVKWLIEDIIPDAQQSRDAEGSILKFSHTHNLAPAQVEALGQLFNTAKTLSHLEKAANRGASFPILDVPAMVGKYLEVPATQRTETPAEEKGAGLSLPRCLAGWQDLGMEQEIKLASATPAESSVSIFAAEKKAKAKRREQEVALKNIELTKQARFDFQEDSRATMETIHRMLRSDSAINFANLETDALSLYGEESKPVLDKLAAYLHGSHWKVARGQLNNAKRLIPDHGGTLDKVAHLLDLHFLIQAADEMIKEATAFATAPAKTDVAESAAPESQARTHAKPDEPKDMTPKDKTPSAPASNGGGSKKNDSGKGGGAGKGGERASFFGGLNKGVDTVADKGYGLLAPVVQSALTGKDNKPQRTVDTDHMDARHMATLQKLLMTDEVLAEADPEKVVSVYNTIREIAPNLAGDANVMRVALRSAVQHDGISPFDIKAFLDTESARQKTDYNRVLQDALRYKGQEMGNRPA